MAQQLAIDRDILIYLKIWFENTVFEYLMEKAAQYDLEILELKWIYVLSTYSSDYGFGTNVEYSF